jgi:hypothetical protein
LHHETSADSLLSHDVGQSCTAARITHLLDLLSFL